MRFIVLRMSLFTFPNQISSCEMIVTTSEQDDRDARFTRLRVSSGYSNYNPSLHMIGFNLGEPLRILHKRQNNEKLHQFAHRQVFFSPFGAPIESAHAVDSDMLYLYLSDEFMTTLMESIGIEKRQIEFATYFGADDPIIASISDQVLHEISHPALGGRVYLDTLKTQLGIHLLRHYLVGWSPFPIPAVEPISPSRRLQRAIDFIHAHLADNLSLAEIAAVEYLSPYYFLRLFKQIYGISPHQYIIQQRVRRAAELLEHTRMTVQEVALAVGFHNHSHLIRHFKRLTGRTPRG
jgi:AraC family transcriptional regulator